MDGRFAMTTAMKAEELFARREQLFNDIVALKKPDHVPVIGMHIHYFADLWKGHSHREAGFDHERHYAAIKDATIEFGWELSPSNALFASDSYEALGTTQLRWPGGELPDDVGFQFVEGEYMKAEEYPEFLADPNGFTVRKIFPRIATNLEGLGNPVPPLYWFADTYYLLTFGAQLLGAPPLRNALESLLALADTAAGYFAADAAQRQEMTELGYPRTWGMPIVPPFDRVSDMLRSLRGSTLDMYRHPDELLGAVDLMLEAQTGMALAALQATGIDRVFIPMHRGARGFMSDEQFERFYWPSFKQLCLSIIEAGGVPCPLFEGDYTPRLKYLAELPPGKIAGHFDKVDRSKFKEILGDSMCFWGNIPASLLCTGRPQQVKDDVKRLIDTFGDTGSLILDCGLGIPDEAKPENLYALREAADEYGVF
jgi:hypothetical protein